MWPPHCLDPSLLLTKTQTVCFSLTGHKYHHCCPPPPLNGSSTLFATIYDLFQGPVTGAKEGGGPGKGLQRPPPPRRKPIFPHPCRETCSKASSKGQACPIVQDEAEGWKGLLFHGTRCPRQRIRTSRGGGGSFQHHSGWWLTYCAPHTAVSMLNRAFDNQQAAIDRYFGTFFGN